MGTHLSRRFPLSSLFLVLAASAFASGCHGGNSPEASTSHTATGEATRGEADERPAAEGEPADESAVLAAEKAPAHAAAPSSEPPLPSSSPSLEGLAGKRYKAKAKAKGVVRKPRPDHDRDGAARDERRAEPQGTSEGLLTAGTWDDNVNFDFFSDYRDKMFAGQRPGLLPITAGEHVRAQRAAQSRPKHTLDISLVIDTTGSMGDEISYLQREFMSLSRTISERYPRAEQRWSLVAYRDQHDTYVVRSFDFGSDAGDFREKLNQLSASGGGDFPEAPELGLQEAAELEWRGGSGTARLVFWVADAPHHAENAGAMATAIRRAQDRQLHIYPVASSGVDELTELTMRSAAQLTGGRYLFLTDDSGVGGAHKEPSMPCYFVTKLNDAILRMVDVELSGSYREPTARETIRRGGNPQNRVCELSRGRQVRAF